MWSDISFNRGGTSEVRRSDLENCSRRNMDKKQQPNKTKCNLKCLKLLDPLIRHPSLVLAGVTLPNRQRGVKKCCQYTEGSFPLSYL